MQGQALRLTRLARQWTYSWQHISSNGLRGEVYLLSVMLCWPVREDNSAPEVANDEFAAGAE